MSVNATLQMHQTVRDAVFSLKKCYKNKDIIQIFQPIFRETFLQNGFTFHRVSEQNQKFVRNVQQLYQKCNKNQAAQKAIADFFKETVSSEYAKPAQPCSSEENMCLLIAKQGCYKFADRQIVTVLTSHWGSTISVGDSSHVIVEPFAHNLEITLGKKSTLTLQHGVFNCTIYGEGEGIVNLGPQSHDNTIITNNLTVNEESSATNNSY